MTTLTLDPTSMSIASRSPIMSRPQVGIERLPPRRMSNEPRESMNCKSCRKRKIKCNRLRPACEACQVFQCPCIYDAVPKKRGPKTDVLEALLKRVDGLEQRLKDQKKPERRAPVEVPPPATNAEDVASNADSAATSSNSESNAKRPMLDINVPADIPAETAVYSPVEESAPSPVVSTETLMETFFNRFHGKPFYILDESTFRQRLQLNQLPSYLERALYSVAAKFTPHPDGNKAATKLSEDYANQARAEIDTDEPSVDALQALLLIAIAYTAIGRGKKAYMLMTNAVGMAIALEMHREVDANARITGIEREMRRRMFWTCYLLDRFKACGSKRPSLIGDKIILLRLPSWSLNLTTLPVEGEFFQSGSDGQYHQGNVRRSQGSSGMLIDISRILGITNRYLAAGGVKGDSHFPWHSLSNLSKIRQDLDIWASGTEDVFSSVDVLFGQPDSAVLVLSKLVYHLIHCLIYRPFLPIDLAELAGTGQNQSWQIEATNMCFAHANAIAELVELGNQTGVIEWPALVGYCICTAGTVHIHGAHYNRNGTAGGVGTFSSSSEFLSREMQQLSDLRNSWTDVQRQRETLQGIFNAHAVLVKSLSSNPTRYSPIFHLEDFFDRYANIGGPGGQTFTFDTANLSLADIIIDYDVSEGYPSHDLYAPHHHQQDTAVEKPSLKRKSAAMTLSTRAEMRGLESHSQHQLPTPGLPPSDNQPHGSYSNRPHPSTTMLQSPVSLHSRQENAVNQAPSLTTPTNDTAANAAAAAAAAAGFTISSPHPSQQVTNLAATPFSPQFNYNNLPGSGATPRDNTNGYDTSGYDPMFGTIPTNAFSSPAAWNNDEDRRPPPAAQVAPSPDSRSNHGSTGTGPGEEKDPFLSLLEQLAETEYARGQGNDIDFFLGANQS